MKQEVIQDFLNLPGIAGIALMDGRSRPYFCGVDQTLNFQQKEALAQGILQVVETIPDGFDSFEFQFTGHQVHIYKLSHGIVLLVLTRNDLDYPTYLKTIKNVKVVLQEDISNAIATFRLIAGNITLSGIALRRPSTGATDTQNTQTRPNSGITTTSRNAGLRPTARTPAPPIREGTPSSVNNASASGPETIASPTQDTLKDLMLALNELSKFTTQYLGTHVIANYWKSTRPEDPWLQNFQVDRSAQFSFTGQTTQGIQSSLSAAEKQAIQTWVAIFMKRCSQVIRDFPSIVEQRALSEAQKSLLLK